MFTIDTAFFQLLVVVPAFLVVLILVTSRQASANPGERFALGITIFTAMLALLGAGTVLYGLSFGLTREIEVTVCEAQWIQRILGRWGCYQVLGTVQRFGDPSKMIPALYGLAGMLVLLWPGRKAVQRRTWIVLEFGLVALSALPFFWGMQFSLTLLVFLIPALWIPLVWRVTERRRWEGASFVLALAALAAGLWFYFYRYSSLMSEPFSPSQILYQLVLVGLLPLSGGLLAARAVKALLGLNKADGRVLPAVLWTLLAGLYTAFSLYITAQESIWDLIMDGSTSLIIPIAALLGGLAGAMLLGLELPWRQKPAALGFIAAFILLLYLPHVFWPAPRGDSATAAEGQRIAQALERYNKRTGSYPAALGQLVPLDKLFIRPPYAIRELDWCYQGGADYYRLGYVYRPVMGVPPEYYDLRIASAQGTVPDTAWACDAELERQREAARQLQRTWPQH